MSGIVERDRIIMNGVVIDSSNGKFKVEVEGGHTVLCTLSGKIRQNSVRILVGDRVSVEVGAYDVSMGRIVFRNK